MTLNAEVIMQPHGILICSKIIIFLTEITLSQLRLVDPDSLRNVSELISSKGYPVEEHNVITEDGYVLAIQRIPRGRVQDGNELSSSKTPVLFQHGFLGAASDYVINFPHQSLGFILADAGYDVWLGNFRGNTYSSHINLSRDSSEFWNFSADEMASEDLPSTIDTVLKITGKKKLQCIGWSQGALIMFALLSEKPEYNKKISLFSAMAPAVYLGHFRAPMALLVPFAELIRPKPPGYTLSRVEVPVAIYWSKGDWFAVEQDVAHLRQELANVVEYYQVPEEQFTHIDFGWGINAEPILYRKMMSVMEDFRT
ncbi:lipase member M-like [Ixodes scapularis]|uniref:lipase member M-like n=1 Tax=Ixodes scapularis TaxID=6945 RepID=UPI001A9F0BB7|nr:lipase member M-like [Ixodes scapularis]